MVLTQTPRSLFASGCRHPQSGIITPKPARANPELCRADQRIHRRPVANAADRCPRARLPHRIHRQIMNGTTSSRSTLTGRVALSAVLFDWRHDRCPAMSGRPETNTAHQSETCVLRTATNLSAGWSDSRLTVPCCWALTRHPDTGRGAVTDRQRAGIQAPRRPHRRRTVRLDSGTVGTPGVLQVPGPRDPGHGHQLPERHDHRPCTARATTLTPGPV